MRVMRSISALPGHPGIHRRAGIFGTNYGNGFRDDENPFQGELLGGGPPSPIIDRLSERENWDDHPDRLTVRVVRHDIIVGISTDTAAAT